MAGSLFHIVDESGGFTMDNIDNLGDAHEALEDCHAIIAYIVGGNLSWLNKVLDDLKQPRLNSVPTVRADQEGE